MLDLEAEARMLGDITVSQVTDETATTAASPNTTRRETVDLRVANTKGISVEQTRFAAGNKLSLSILKIISIISIALLVLCLIQMFIGMNAVALKPTTIQDQKEIAAIYSEIIKTSTDQTVKIFQVTIIQALLPILTAVLGYTFARSENNKE